MYFRQTTYTTTYNDTHTYFHFKILHNFRNKDLEAYNILFPSLDRIINVAIIESQAKFPVSSNLKMKV